MQFVLAEQTFIHLKRTEAAFAIAKFWTWHEATVTLSFLAKIIPKK